MARKMVKKATKRKPSAETKGELVILTGLSGSGKLSALKAFEDLGYYAVDNLPLELVPRFAELVRQSKEGQRAALVVDVREGMRLDEFPAILKRVRKVLPTRVVFLEASDEALVRRFSETRRPHPLGRSHTVVKSIQSERKRLDPIRNVADIVLDTTKFNVHDLRAHINAQFERRGERPESGDFVDQLRVQEWRAFGGGPGVRCAVSAESALRSGVSEADGTASEGGEVCAAVSADAGVSGQDDGDADVSFAALHQRGQELSDGGVWMYGRAAPVGVYCGRDEEAIGGRRIPGEDGAPGYAAVRDACKAAAH